MCSVNAYSPLIKKFKIAQQKLCSPSVAVHFFVDEGCSHGNQHYGAIAPSTTIHIVGDLTPEGRLV
jgi:hypothetical protein